MYDNIKNTFIFAPPKKVLPMRHFIIMSCFLIFLSSCKPSNQKLNWLSMTQASDIVAKSGNKKKFLIDVYTDWCSWCKVMDKKTFTDPELIKYLNENFNVVKFNAEQRESLIFNGKEYVWVLSGRNGVNTLALELLQGRMSYPSLVYLNEKLEPILVSPGFKDANALMSELKSL
ncbi:MAG: DUF255 domain-containing protein [Saprospiraceae bacterium]|jgi:thioredoxin-related protein